MKHGSLFSGIGGFDLAAEWMDWENVFHCENNGFCQKILKHYWPDAKSYEDITKTDFTEWNRKVDIVSGGFPCQPYSQAGKRKGKADDRHLWPQMLRAIREIQPRWIVGENVSGLLNWNRGMVLDEIKAELEASGFEVFPPLVLPACGKNAPHRRDRLWIVADSAGSREESSFFRTNEVRQYANDTGQVCYHGSERNVTNPSDSRCKNEFEAGISAGPFNRKFNGIYNEGFRTWEKFPTQSPVCGRNDGISNRVDRIKALGNAIVPQVAYEIFKAIQQIENEK